MTNTNAYGPVSAPQYVQAGRAAATCVSVTDIDMPFWSMVVFMIKWALASIPAVLILAVLGGLLSFLASMFFAVLVAGAAAGH